MRIRFMPFLFTALLAACGSSGEEEQRKAVDAPADTAPAGPMSRSESNGNIRVESPRPGETLDPSRFTIRGTARTFEGNVLYRLVYDSVLTLVDGFTTAAMPEVGKFGPFSATVEYTTDWGGPAVLEVYEEDAASGEETNMVRIPVVLPAPPKGNAKQIYVYFPNGGLEQGTGSDCEAVYPVRRELREGSVALARGALYYLLKGLTQQEMEAGYETRLPEGLRLQGLRLDSGIVRLRFSRHLNRLEKRCHAETVRAQIEQTLAQFPTVNAVAIDVEGTTWASGR